MLVKYAYFHEFYKLILSLVFSLLEVWLAPPQGQWGRGGGGGGGICPKCPILDPPLPWYHLGVDFVGPIAYQSPAGMYTVKACNGSVKINGEICGKHIILIIIVTITKI